MEARPVGGSDSSLATLYLSPRGRIPRSVLWRRFYLPILALTFVAALADVSGGYLSDDNPEGPISAVTSLLLAWPGIVGVVKRAHDLDMRFREILGIWAAMLVGAVFAVGMMETIPVAAFVIGTISLAALIYLIWIGIKLYFVRGTHGPNRFGEDPLTSARLA